MRVVDFSPFPDRSAHRAELDRALERVDLGNAERSAPTDNTAAFGISFPADLSNDQLRELARNIRAQLEAILPEDLTVEFVIADESADKGGAPHPLQ